VLEGARINIIRIPGSGHCLDCAAETPLTAIFSACQSCGSYQVTITTGEEMRVREIEVDE
jgi:hydrogenase nickel incorporation protein HypA/HybF